MSGSDDDGEAVGLSLCVSFTVLQLTAHSFAHRPRGCPESAIASPSARRQRQSSLPCSRAFTGSASAFRQRRLDRHLQQTRQRISQMPLQGRPREADRMDHNSCQLGA